MLGQANYLAKKIDIATSAYYQRASVYRKQACLPVTKRSTALPEGEDGGSSNNSSGTVNKIAHI